VSGEIEKKNIAGAVDKATARSAWKTNNGSVVLK